MRVKNIVKEKSCFKTTEKNKKPHAVQRLLREQIKLSIHDDDWLCRKSNGYHQIILPDRYKEAVYIELNINMGILEADRTLELIKEGFTSPTLFHQ